MGKISELINKDRNNNNNNIFSIFIPTFSREESLKLTLESVFEHWKLKSLDKIIISDNNESSLAYDIIQKFNPLIIDYSKNSFNIGIDRNMLRFLDLCNSKYCWLLGDDDFLNESSYELIEPFLKMDFDFLIMLDGNQITKYKTGVHTLNNINEIGDFFKYFWDKTPFGNIIVNVDKAKMINNISPFDLKKYIGSSHAYSGLLWEILCSEFSTKNIVVIEEKAVDLGVVTKTWSDSAIKIFLIEIPLWFRLLPSKLRNQSDKVASKYIKSISQRSYLILYAKYIKMEEDNVRKFSEYISSFPFIFKVKVKMFCFIFPIYCFLIHLIKNKKV